jgi:hypothetical protein
VEKICLNLFCTDLKLNLLQGANHFCSIQAEAANPMMMATKVMAMASDKIISFVSRLRDFFLFFIAPRWTGFDLESCDPGDERAYNHAQDQTARPSHG